jgi:flagellar biosynthesis GTPase FlhF
MSFLNYFLNPTFLFLAILVLLFSLLFTYFESKIRSQNHTIESMVSLVSTVVEDIEGVKNGLNYLANNHNNNSISKPIFDTLNNQNNKLITVSDDEEDNDDDDDDSTDMDDEDNDDEDDEEDDDDEDEDDEDDEEDEDNDVEDNDADEEESLVIDYENHEMNHIKLLKIDNVDEIKMEDEIPSEEMTNLEDTMNEIEFESSKEEPLDNNIYNDLNELKSININLEETVDSQDYKKLPLQKLRSLVYEKGLVTDSSKLKKNELLKLLGID